MQPNEIQIGGFGIPKKYVNRRGAILGKVGSGKSYTGGVMEEEMVLNNIPFVTIDIVGAHWGVREKFDVVILGGPHADIDILPVDGTIIAQMIQQSARNFIIDISEWLPEDQLQFFINWAETIYHLQRTPRHYYVEEADLFIPQKRDYDLQKHSSREMNKLIRRGRQRGIGVTLISQRPSLLNKDVLTQFDLAIIHHLVGPQDLAAVSKILEHGGVGDTYELLDQIAKFQPGEALIYSPSWLGRYKVTKIRPRLTYHAGEEPELGAKDKTIEIIKVEKDSIIRILNRLVQPINIPVEHKPYMTYKRAIPIAVGLLLLSMGLYGMMPK